MCGRLAVLAKGQQGHSGVCLSPKEKRREDSAPGFDAQKRREPYVGPLLELIVHTKPSDLNSYAVT